MCYFLIVSLKVLEYSIEEESIRGKIFSENIKFLFFKDFRVEFY